MTLLRSFAFLFALTVAVSARASSGSIDTTVAAERTTGPRWELRTAPLAFLAQWTTIDVGYRVTSKISTGPAVVSYAAKSGNMFLPSFEGQAIGWYANYYLGSANVSGGYSSLHVYHEDFLSHPHARREEERFKSVGQRANAIVGYRWVRSMFDVLLGGGVMAFARQTDKLTYKSTSIAGPERLEPSSETNSGMIPIVECKMGVRF